MSGRGWMRERNKYTKNSEESSYKYTQNMERGTKGRGRVRRGR
jgi:hypothetical protein